jgi:hypothetical protein
LLAAEGAQVCLLLLTIDGARRGILLVYIEERSKEQIELMQG